MSPLSKYIDLSRETCGHIRFIFERRTIPNSPFLGLQIAGQVQMGRSGCNIIHGATTFSSHITGSTYPINTYLDCSSSYMIYLLTCACGVQYVDVFRINQHRSNPTRGFLNHNVSRQAVTAHPNDFSIYMVSVCEQFHPDISNCFDLLQKREMFWMYQLNTISPFVLNEALESVFWTLSLTLDSRLYNYQLFTYNLIHPNWHFAPFYITTSVNPLTSSHLDNQHYHFSLVRNNTYPYLLALSCPFPPFPIKMPSL